MGTKTSPGPYDCYAKANPNEPIFVLLGRDPMAGQLIRMWAKGAELRQADSLKISNALQCAIDMENYCRTVGSIPMRWTATPPVITRAAPKCDVTRDEVADALSVASENDLSMAPYNVIERLARACGLIDPQ